MKLPEKFWIVIHSEAHSKLVQDKLFELGHKWASNNKNYLDHITKPNPQYGYGRVSVSSDGYDLGYSPKEYYFNNEKSYVQISTNDLLSVKPNKQETVRLNNEHEAVVSSDGTIKVGCQTFSHEIVKSLAQAIEEVTK